MSTSKNSRKLRLLATVAVCLLASSVIYAGLFGDEKVKIPMKIPSEINIEDLHSMAILPVDSDQDARVVLALEEQIVQVKGESLELVNEQTLIDRMREQEALLVSIERNSSYLHEHGAKLGIDALIFGWVRDLRIEDMHGTKNVKVSRKETYYNSEGKKKKRTVTEKIPAPKVTRQGHLSMSLGLYDTRSGSILIQKEIVKARTHVQVFHDKAKKEDKIPLPSEREVEYDLIADAATEFVHAIVPYTEVKKVVWDGGCNCDDEGKMVKKGKLEEAEERLRTRLEKRIANVKKRRKDKGKDKKMAGNYYNLGLIEEIRGDLEGALALYQQAKVANKKPAKHIKKGHKRVEALIAQWQVYNGQGGEMLSQTTVSGE